MTIYDYFVKIKYKDRFHCEQKQTLRIRSQLQHDEVSIIETIKKQLPNFKDPKVLKFDRTYYKTDDEKTAQKE